MPVKSFSSAGVTMFLTIAKLLRGSAERRPGTYTDQAPAWKLALLPSASATTTHEKLYMRFSVLCKLVSGLSLLLCSYKRLSGNGFRPGSGRLLHERENAARRSRLAFFPLYFT